MPDDTDPEVLARRAEASVAGVVGRVQQIAQVGLGDAGGSGRPELDQDRSARAPIRWAAAPFEQALAGPNVNAAALLAARAAGRPRSRRASKRLVARGQ
ncbi:MAG: hypothetical protein IPG91_14275 [Ideonella sp.]|nr:hypothetical protein [Ideonella sp.]